MGFLKDIQKKDKFISRGIKIESSINMEDFVEKLIELTGVSEEYAIAAWCTIRNICNNPVYAAIQYAKKINDKILI